MEIAQFHQQVPVVEQSQPSAARFLARDAAEAAGFTADEAHRAGLVATELATNLVKHATGGELLVRRVRSGPGGEIELLAIDRGPGTTDVSRSLTDGYSTAGSPGNGLGAVRRLADDFDMYSQAGRGTIVFTRLRASRGSASLPGVFEAAGVSVPKENESVCGDSWQVAMHQDGLLIAIVDGLGHGLQAREASSAAFAALNGRWDFDLRGALRTMHDGMRHTRGAAGAIAGIRGNTLQFAGVGNIGGTIARQGAPSRQVVSSNGTLGHEARQFREFAYPWEHDAMFVMFSDGLASHWSIDDYPGIRQHHPAVIAAALYRDFNRGRDDVTVVIGRERR